MLSTTSWSRARSKSGRASASAHRRGVPAPSAPGRSGPALSSQFPRTETGHITRVGPAPRSTSTLAMSCAVFAQTHVWSARQASEADPAEEGHVIPRLAPGKGAGCASKPSGVATASTVAWRALSRRARSHPSRWRRRPRPRSRPRDRSSVPSCRALSISAAVASPRVPTRGREARRCLTASTSTHWPRNRTSDRLASAARARAARSALVRRCPAQSRLPLEIDDRVHAQPGTRHRSGRSG